ncbi:MAG: transketolase [Alphaproteobacteria bacterium]|nr:MAG: transketolase [Alphaproteobacteria bacterium]
MVDERTLTCLAALEQRVLWLASWMIHHANHLRPKADGDIKVGGHQASSASLATIMTALYYHVLRPEDRVAVKPHAAPIFHAIQYLAGNQSREALENFRGFGGAQSYPSRTKDTDDVDFSTGSVGLGVAQTLFSSLVQDYVAAHGWMRDRPLGRMIALMGDAEMDEGNIYEALLEGWKQDLRHCWWIVDYNRQSLDAVIHEGLWQTLEAMFKSFGWRVVILKHGPLQRAAFAEPGGDKLARWIDACSNQLYSALTFQGGAAWRKHLLDDLGADADCAALIGRRSDAELARLMSDLGGHDMASLLDAFAAAAEDDRPTLFLCYTIKGYRLPLAGHKDNHAGLLTPRQMDAFRDQMGVREGHEWDKWEGAPLAAETLQRFVDNAAFFAHGPRRLTAPAIAVPDRLPVPDSKGKPVSTQMGFGQILNAIARDDSDLAARIVTTAPDVTVSTNLGPWVNRRGLFARRMQADTFQAERIPSTYKWSYAPEGQHFELGIAESNLFVLLSALGLSHGINGVRLLPVGTVYDPFIYRGADQLNYACYQNARFLLVGTPSGVTLAPEGGAHQSIGTPLVGVAQDGLASFEPAFIDELAVIMRFAFDYMQREGAATPDGHTWLADAAGGAVYMRLSTRPVEQPGRVLTADLERDIIAGGYWMREPGANAQIVVAYSGALAPEAIAAVGLMGEDRRDVGLLAVTSADRLHAGWTAAGQARERGLAHARSHIERLLDKVPPHCALITVIDGHPASLSWLGAVHGHRTRALGIERFGQTGRIDELYRHYGVDAQGILRAAQSMSAGPPIRYLRQA